MYKNKKVSVVIPTYNEAKSIRAIIDGFFETGLVDEVIAVDNNALGNTAEEIRKTKAIHIKESDNQGYGYALMRGMKETSGDIIVMCEADGTFQAKDIEKLLSYSDEFDVVFGTRTSRSAIFSGAFMPFPVRFANWLWAKFIEVMFNGPVLTDVGCTYKLISKKALEKIKPFFPMSKGDGRFSPELMIWLLQQDLNIIEVPVIFRERVGESMYTGSIWKAAKLGFRMLSLIIKYRFFRKERSEVISTKKHKLETVIFLCAVILAFGLLFVTQGNFPNDDQFILLRYIDNIAFGEGFVFNQEEKILGATTPLFTLLCAFFKYLFKFVDTRLLVGMINTFLFGAGAVFFYRLSRRFMSNKFSYIAVAVFILNISRLIPEGMESALFILTVFAFLHYLLEEKNYTASVFLALAVLTRPDAGIIAFLAFIYWIIHIGLEKTIRVTMLCIAIALPWLIWSTWYFGSFIPASLVAKTHINEIINQPFYQSFKVQFSSLSRIYWGRIFDPENIPVQIIANLLPFLILVFVAVREKLNRNNWLVFAIPISYLMAFGVSNPVMFAWYITQIEPFWILVSFAGFAILFEKLQNKFNYSLLQIFLLVIILMGPSLFFTSQLISKDRGSKLPLYEIALYINEHKKEGESIGVNNMGIISYYTGSYLYDFFGLVNDYAYAFYKKRESCADQETMYVIPPSLVMHTMPTWLVLSSDKELSECFKQSRWFKNNYVFEKKLQNASIWKLKKDF